jgi:chorismate mutase/prephenate dehydratase
MIHGKRELILRDELYAQHVFGLAASLLAPFATHGVSMTRFESRPARTGLWEYLFFVDVIGHESDPLVAKALAELRQKAPMLKILGSYPSAIY